MLIWGSLNKRPRMEGHYDKNKFKFKTSVCQQCLDKGKYRISMFPSHRTSSKDRLLKVSKSRFALYVIFVNVFLSVICRGRWIAAVWAALGKNPIVKQGTRERR